jgi:flavin reductase (DIM6/NTAB) family NADH-FMN oxidoreductase RutF
MAISSDSFRKAMGSFATGVTVITTRNAAGKPWGFTVNSFASVSLNPPLVLFCVGNGGESFANVDQAEFFAVNYLTEDQEWISRQFAARGITDRFEGVAYREGLHGTPLIEGSLGAIQCRKVASHGAGDHVIVVCEVLDAELRDGNPLLFFRSDYGRISTPLRGR